ncbi:hypothetical protein PRABACTJOHN_03932 [Parabacteroides johnsonii DSM 18315]|uniref:Uncharacterized protein n=1 Tax=Parabacteroides johnsonii DSM 18315 TaxID=537006 RepID=B7BFU7_9BACT|nr:hypothetical protein PRABACTJOHN_03932 [Parabacteroides johnsonii DSM 18315]
MFESANDNLWVRNKTKVFRRGRVLLRPIKRTSAMSGSNGQSRALPLQTTIILYGNVIHVFIQINHHLHPHSTGIRFTSAKLCITRANAMGYAT